MRRATRRGGLVVLVCLAVVGLGGKAHAQGGAPPSKQYLKAYNDAQTAYNDAIMRGDFSKAKKGFERAIKFDKRFPGPYRYLALIASAEKAWEECLSQAFLAVKKNPTSTNAPKVRQLHAECRKELKRRPFQEQFGDGGAISVETVGVTGAKVKLNGLTYGATPFIRGFAVGAVEVEVELKGYLPYKGNAEVLMGLVTDVIVELDKDPNAKTDTGPVQSAEDAKEGWVDMTVRPEGATITIDGKPPERDEKGRLKADTGTYDVEVSAPNHESWRRRVRFSRGQSRKIDVVLRSTAARQSLRKKGYMSLAAAGVFVGVGAYFGILEMRKFEAAQDIWDTETERPAGADTSGVEPVHTRDDIKDLRDKGKRYQIISGASFAIAAVALGASVYYFAKERPVERKGFPLPLAVAPTVTDDGGLGAQVTYSTELDW